MSTHTPGPWSVSDKNAISAPQKATKSDVKYGIKRTHKIARVMMNLSGSGANARLIAAAPDLLEALQLFIQYEEEAERGDDVSMMLTYAELRKSAHGAIAKATEVKP